MTFQTRWCPRMFREIPYVGCGCVDCRLIHAWRWMRRRILRRREPHMIYLSKRDQETFVNALLNQPNGKERETNK